ncbi:MAG: DUF1003 domain-containing protein [Candidatus Moranbacteria bacterium]|nr:DUF1003 domain-containing protein [Candidatus Moranbacteria bacterium]NTW46331.1 DUF1003 domain-containing protein [Candidatus Moranbacteria bacterium]
MRSQNKRTDTPVTRPSRLEEFAFGAIRSVGSIPSLVVHTVLFIGIFTLQLLGFSFDQIMLILTTIVSLEAIYLSIFIQMSVNRQSVRIDEVHEDVEEISEDIDDISEDVEELSKDIDTIQEEVKEIGEDVEEISEDIEEISEDVEKVGEEIEKDDHEDSVERTEDLARLAKIESTLEVLLKQIRDLDRR